MIKCLSIIEISSLKGVDARKTLNTKFDLKSITFYSKIKFFHYLGHKLLIVKSNIHIFILIFESDNDELRLIQGTKEQRNISKNLYFHDFIVLFIHSRIKK